MEIGLGVWSWVAFERKSFRTQFISSAAQPHDPMPSDATDKVWPWCLVLEPFVLVYNEYFPNTLFVNFKFLRGIAC